jgi:hypothetical protein
MIALKLPQDLFLEAMAYMHDIKPAQEAELLERRKQDFKESFAREAGRDGLIREVTDGDL